MFKKPATTILNIPLNYVSPSQYQVFLQQIIKTKQQSHLALINPEFVVASLTDPEFQQILMKKTVNIADGIGLVWASKFLSLPATSSLQILWQFMITLFQTLFNPSALKKHNALPERIPAIIANYQIIALCAKYKLRVYLYGARGNIAKKLSHHLCAQYPDLHIVGTAHGYDNPQHIVDQIRLSQADVLIMASDAPIQVKFIDKYLSMLPNVRLAVGVGGWFDQSVGQQRIAPNVVRKIHLEWLYRAFVERRFARAIYRAVLVFSFTILRFKLKELHLKH